MRVITAGLFLAVLCSPATALAHALLLRSEPANREVLLSSPAYSVERGQPCRADGYRDGMAPPG